MATINATSGQLVIYDDWVEGNLTGTFTIHGTLNGTTLTITSVDLSVAHGATNYQTNNSYVYYLTINGWEISTTVKETTGYLAKVNYSGTMWTGTKTFTLASGTSSLSCDSKIYISNGRWYYNTGVKSIDLGATAGNDTFKLKVSNTWRDGDIYYKYNNSWVTPTEVFLKQNGYWWQRLEYIENDGNQNLGSGIIINDTIKLQFKFRPFSITGGNIIGNVGSPEADSFRFFNYNNQWYLDYGSGYNRINGGSCTTNVDYNIEYGNRYVKDLNTNTNIISGSAVSFSEKSYDVHIENFPARWYYLKIYKNNQLVRDYVPVKNPVSGAVGMLDLITNVFYGADDRWGSGSFIAGPVISW